jgi:hypothetical protein
MAKQEQAFSNSTIRSLFDTHRRLSELKYLYLKIVESHNIEELAKVEFKSLLVELAASVDRYFNDLRFRKINKFNVDDVEKGIEKFIKSTEKRIRKVRKAGIKLSPAKIRMDRIPAGEAEIDSALLSGRVFDEQALEKDKLDHLNAIKRYLVEATGGEEKAKARKKPSSTDQALMDLKIRNYCETLSGYDSSNLDILYKVRAKLQNSLRSKTRINAIPGSLAIPAVLNHNELYIHDQGNGNFSLSYRDANLAILLEILLVHTLEEKSFLYRGEISGWAETGPNRVEFLLKDKQYEPGMSLDNPLSAGTVMEFLKKAELDSLYTQIRKICQEKAAEPDRLHQKVRREMKQKVSQALDDVL